MVTAKPFYRPKPQYIYSDEPVKFTATNSIYTSPNTIYTLSTTMPPSPRCQNCGHTHNHTSSDSPSPSSSPSCFFITIRRSGRDRLPLSTPHSIPLSPSNTTQSQQLRDYLWSEFSSLKAEVDLDRDSLTQQRAPKSKGRLKEKAPIPWLSWSSPCGQSGQTRNKANFCALWDRVMADACVAKQGRVWVSSVLLLTLRDETGTVVWSDGGSVGEDEPGLVGRQRHGHGRGHGQLRDEGRGSENEKETVMSPVGAERREASRRPECLCS